jgi:chromatin remodeling complex protein RSC6
MSETAVVNNVVKTRRVKKVVKKDEVSSEASSAVVPEVSVASSVPVVQVAAPEVSVASDEKKVARKKRVVKKEQNDVVQDAPAPVATQSVQPVVQPVEQTTDNVELTFDAESEFSQQLQSVGNDFNEMSKLLTNVLNTVHSTGFGQRELRLVYKSCKNMSKLVNKVQDEVLTQSLKKNEELQKTITKRNRKNKGKSNPNSGIQKKHPAHDKLAEFLGVDAGFPVSRVEALKAVSAYVRDNNLQVETNKKTFHLKGKLSSLFPNTEVMGYTEIMKAIKPFFPPAQKN